MARGHFRAHRYTVEVGTSQAPASTIRAGVARAKRELRHSFASSATIRDNETGKTVKIVYKK